MRVKDKVAIVTGGSRGIGRETSLLLAREGAKVVIAARTIEEADKVVDEIKALGREAIAVRTDVTSLDEVYRMVKATLDTFGRIDILVNVAGGSGGPSFKTKKGPFAESKRERWDEMIDLNLYGTFNCARAVLNHMIERRSGKIVNISSIVGVIGMEYNAEYSAAKAGVIGFTKALAKEVAQYGINVNCVSPGIVGSARYYAVVPKETREVWETGIAMGRAAEPDEIVGAVLFLASDEANYITGANILVDGCMRPALPM